MDYSKGAPRRDLGDGRSIWLYPQIFNFKIVIGPTDAPTYDDDWCFPDFYAAVVAFVSWDPLTEKEPSGWHRHRATCRRRPDGDAAREYIAD